MRPELRSAGWTPAIRQELVEVVEAPDVADLGEEGRRDRRADARDRLEPPGRLAIEERRDAPVGGLDLALEQVVLVEQEADLEGDLGVELGHGDRVGRGGLEPFRPGRRPAGDGPGPALASASVDVRRRVAARAVGATRRTSRAVRHVGSSKSSPSSGKPSSTSRMRRWQTLACSVTRVIAKRAA